MHIVMGSLPILTALTEVHLNNLWPLSRTLIILLAALICHLYLDELLSQLLLKQHAFPVPLWPIRSGLRAS